MTYRHPLGFLLGLEDVALLRAHAGDGFDRSFVEARMAEIQTLLDLRSGPLGSQGEEVGQVDTVQGYRAWAATYDTEDNPLIAVEQPIVREITDGLPSGSALDAACGTGRHTAYLTARGHRVVGVDNSPDMRARPRTSPAGQLPRR